MAKGASLDIKVDARGNAVTELQRVKRAMAANEKQLQALTATGEKSQAMFTRQQLMVQRWGVQLDKAKVALQELALGMVGFGLVGRGFATMVTEGAKSLDMLDTLSAGVKDLPGLIVRVQTATAGMIDRQSIVEAAAEFKAFGLDVQQLPQVLGALSATSIRTGKDMGFLTQSMIEGISKTSDMRLDNLGLIGVFKQARAELEAQGVAYDDAALKTRALNNAVAQLNAQNADIDLMKTRTAQITAWSAALKDLTTNLQEASYEGAAWWGVFDAAPLAEVSAGLEDLIARSNEFAGTGVDAVLPYVRKLDTLLPGVGGAVMGVAAAYDYINPKQIRHYEGMATLQAQLKALSAAQKLALWDQWAASAAWANEETRSLIIGVLGTRDALVAQAAAADRAAQAAQGLAWWQAELNKLFAASGMDGKKPKGAKKPKTAKTKDKPRRGGGGGGRRAEREAAQKALEAASSQLALLRASGEVERAQVKAQQQMAALDEKRNRWLTLRIAKRRVAAMYDAQRALILAEESKALLTIADAEDEVTEALEVQAKARTQANIAVREIVSLSMLDRDIAAAKEPLERASLELQRARLEAAFALKQLGDDENEALVKRAEITERLRDAQEQYNTQVERINNDELASQLRGVSRAAQGVAQQMQQIDSSMAPAAVAVADSADAWARYAEGQDNVATALANTVGAVGVAAQSWAKDEEMKAGIAALMQAAYAVAAFASQEYGAGAAHLVAAGMFTAIAAGAGGGGAAAGGGGGAPSAAAVGGAGGDTGGGAGGEAAPDRRIIVQFHGGVLGSPQDVARSIQRAAHSARGSGQEPGW